MCFFTGTQALDKMESEWEPMLMEISPYKETGTFIMKSSEETGQMLEGYNYKECSLKRALQVML